MSLALRDPERCPNCGASGRVIESRRLPGSGAGPSPDRMFIGSEGILGIITEAWMRLQDAPKFRASATARFKDFLSGARAVRALGQSGLYPSNCRLIDASEAAGTGADDGSAALLVLGFEGADHPLDAWVARAIELARDHGGIVDQPKEKAGGHREGAAGAWRNAFLRAPLPRPLCESTKSEIRGAISERKREPLNTP